MCIRDRYYGNQAANLGSGIFGLYAGDANKSFIVSAADYTCLLYTSDAADDLLCVDLGGRRIIKKKKNNR